MGHGYAVRGAQIATASTKNHIKVSILVYLFYCLSDCLSDCLSNCFDGDRMQSNFRVNDLRTNTAQQSARKSLLRLGTNERFLNYTCDCPSKPKFHSLPALRSHIGKVHPPSNLADDRHRYHCHLPPPPSLSLSLTVHLTVSLLQTQVCCH